MVSAATPVSLAETAATLFVAARAEPRHVARGPVRVVCCFEAGYDGFWLHRRLCARGIENRVLDAASLLVNRRARRAKTDRLDAAGLLRTRMALERGETQVCRVVTCPHRPRRMRAGDRASEPGSSSSGVSTPAASRGC